MSKKIILNSKNYIGNGMFTYNFPFQQDFTDDEVAITSFNMFNSFYNISSTIGNNILTISYPNATTNALISISTTIPDGFYDTSSFNTYLQSVMYSNGLYYINAVSGNVVYFISMVVLSTEYKNSITLYKLNSNTLVNGQIYGTGKDYFLNISFNSNLGELFGFSSNVVYGPTVLLTTTSSTSQVVKSNLVPQINPFNSIIITCSLVDQLGLSNPSDYLYSCSLNASYGSMMQPKKLENIYTRCRAGSCRSISLQFYDNNFNRLQILDNNTMIILTFRPKKKQ